MLFLEQWWGSPQGPERPCTGGLHQDRRYLYCCCTCFAIVCTVVVVGVGAHRKRTAILGSRSHRKRTAILGLGHSTKRARSFSAVPPVSILLVCVCRETQKPCRSSPVLSPSFWPCPLASEDCVFSAPRLLLPSFPLQAGCPSSSCRVG